MFEPVHGDDERAGNGYLQARERAKESIVRSGIRKGERDGDANTAKHMEEFLAPSRASRLKRSIGLDKIADTADGVWENFDWVGYADWQPRRAKAPGGSVHEKNYAPPYLQLGFRSERLGNSGDVNFNSKRRDLTVQDKAATGPNGARPFSSATHTESRERVV